MGMIYLIVCVLAIMLIWLSVFNPTDHWFLKRIDVDDMTAVRKAEKRAWEMIQRHGNDTFIVRETRNGMTLRYYPAGFNVEDCFDGLSCLEICDHRCDAVLTFAMKNERPIYQLRYLHSQEAVDKIAVRIHQPIPNSLSAEENVKILELYRNYLIQAII